MDERYSPLITEGWRKRPVTPHRESAHRCQKNFAAAYPALLNTCCSLLDR